MRPALLACFLFLTACGGSVVTSPEEQGTTCSIPKFATCATGTAFLLCNGSNGKAVSCVTDDVTGCSTSSAMPGVTFTCVNQCKQGEYAVACNAGTTLPTGCVTGKPIPGGTTYSCCPCNP